MQRKPTLDRNANLPVVTSLYPSPSSQSFRTLGCLTVGQLLPSTAMHEAE